MSFKPKDPRQKLIKTLIQVSGDDQGVEYVPKEVADKLAEALESLDQPLCERIIDRCGYSPEDETKESLVQSMNALSDENAKSLEIVRQALKEHRGEK